MARYLIFILSVAVLNVLLVFNANFLKLKEWHKTNGIMIHSFTYGPSKPYKGSISTYPDISYSYKVAGKEYLGHRFGPLDYVFFEKVSGFETLKPDTRVYVHYNPESPDESYLRINYPELQMLSLLSIAIVIFLLGVFYNYIVETFKRYLKLG